MAKTEEEILAKQAKKEKKEKKDKKRKLEETDDAEPTKKVKKEKKHKRDSTAAPVEDTSMVDAALKTEDVDVKESTRAEEADDVEGAKESINIPIGALVPFANPLADDKAQKKVLKSVKKGAKAKALKRGVKECVKAIRKSPQATPSSLASDALPNGIVILAADISPMDVISHIPVLCEDHNIPYVYVPSRAELGAAGSTKRPTSVVMLMPKVGKKGASEGDEWEEQYKDLHKLAVKLGQTVKV